jgi:formamidase
MNATLRVRFTVHSGAARDQGIRDPRSPVRLLGRPGVRHPAPVLRHHRHVGRPDGELRAEDATLAARNALLNMIDHLGERGWNRQQAYAICSVAVDLKISQLVDVPSFLVSAFLPEDIFTS